MALQAAVFALQNATNHTAALFRQAVASLNYQSGVVNPGDFNVAAQATPNMTVACAAGMAWIPGSQVGAVSGNTWTTQQDYFVLNDAPVTLSVATADATNPRIDLVVVYVQDSFYSGAANTPQLGIITGTPAATPAAPSAPNNALLLGTLAVAANATSITNANITAAPRRMALWGTPIACTSTTRPTAALWAGQPIYETDTGRMYQWTGSAWSYVSGTNPNAWTSITPNSPYTVGTEGFRYRVVNNNTVYFQMHLLRPTGTTTGAVYTFPAALRPPWTHWWVPESGGNPVGELRLTSDGILNLTFTPSTATAMVVAGSWPIN